MSSFRSTADLARNDPVAYSMLGNCIPDLSDDSELVRIQPDPEPTPAQVQEMLAGRPADQCPALRRFAIIADALDDLAASYEDSLPEREPMHHASFIAGEIRGLRWGVKQIRRVLAELQAG